MSYDGQIIHTSNRNKYLDMLFRNPKKRKTKKSISITKNSKKKQKSFEVKKIIEYRNIKKLSNGPLFSTFESTMTSSHKHQNDEENSILREISKISPNPKTIVMPKNEDMIFLYETLFGKNAYISKQDTNNKTLNLNNSENRNCYHDYDFVAIKKYLIKLQKALSYNESLVNSRYNKGSGMIRDTFQLQKLEDLITRYCLMIHFFIRSYKLKEAKKLFLLMIKENFNYIINVENQIYMSYTDKNRRLNYTKDIPKSTYQLLKIYSLLIRFSQLFNSNNYHNIFLSKYFKIQLLNYKFFMIKANNRGFSIEIKNQLKYLFSYWLHNAFYYCIQNYLPMRIPITLNHSIISLYHNIDESLLIEPEKILLMKTLYNQGILYYIDNQKEDALLCLNMAKEKIMIFNDNGFELKIKKSNRIYNKKRKDSFIELDSLFKKELFINSTPKNEKRRKNSIRNYDMDNTRRKTDNMEKSRNKIDDLFLKNKRENSIEPNPRKFSIFSMDLKKGIPKIKDFKTSKNEAMLFKINENFKKDKISINDIELLIQFGKENSLLVDDSVIIEKTNSFLGKFNQIKKDTNFSKGIRGSHIDFHTSIKIKNFNVPEKYKNPLLRNIELLMCLIELDKKNYEKAYGHILKVLYLVIILKISNNNNEYDKDFFNQQKFEIDKYFELIKKLYEIDIKNKKLSAGNSSDSNFNLDDIKIDLNNNINNPNIKNNSIIFETKTYSKNFLNIPTETSILKANNYNYNNYNSKALLEFEKFFIFLNNLSLYQIKILNETQPDSDKRNNLPILFSNQFKDCLSMPQRIELDNLQSMSLNRFIILKDPNNWIMPSNLNVSLLKNNMKIINTNRKKRGNLLSFDRFNYIDENFRKTKEYKSYLSIINSRKCTRDIKEFIINNRKFVIKILTDSDEQEINNIIEYPYIIIEPIKNYKRRLKHALLKSKNIKTRNYFENMIESGKRYQRMRTATVHSKNINIKNELKKMSKRNNSIMLEASEFENIVKKYKL